MSKKERVESSLVQRIVRWVDQAYPDKEAAKNRCNEAVRKMVEMFPEITVQVGHANGIYHCWGVNANGEILDPTRRQFEGAIKYNLIASRFLKKHEIELSTGAIFLDT